MKEALRFQAVYTIRMSWHRRIPTWVYIAAAGAIVVLVALIERWMGHDIICQCGTVKLWGPANLAGEDSQHFSDWYTLSHIIHGIAFYGLFRLVGRKRWPVALCLLLAVLVESGWEILENSPIIINHYRETTVSTFYNGDSILNSVSDILFMAGGFWLAWYLPVWVTIALVVAMELLAAYVIRDNLTINILMFLYPSEGIVNWQAGAP